MAKGLPNRGERKTLVFKIPVDIKDSLTDRARDEGISISSYITGLLARDLSLKIPDYIETEKSYNSTIGRPPTKYKKS